MQGVSPVIVSSRVMFSRLFLPVGLTVLCVWLGWAAARVLVPERTTPTPFPLTSTPTGLPTGPTQIMVLVVDDLAAVRPSLEGVWVATATPGSAQSTWVGFSTDLAIDQDTLGSYFDTGYGIGRSLQDAAVLVEAGLRRLTAGAVAPSFRVVVDHAQMAGVVDRLGGVTVVDQAMGGAQLIAAYDAIGSSGPAARLSFQAALLEAIEARLQSTASAGLSAYFAEQAPTYGLDSIQIASWLTGGVFPEQPDIATTQAAR
jgi:hypothetical protein